MLPPPLYNRGNRGPGACLRFCRGLPGQGSPPCAGSIKEGPPGLGEGRRPWPLPPGHVVSLLRRCVSPLPPTPPAQKLLLRKKTASDHRTHPPHLSWGVAPPPNQPGLAGLWSHTYRRLLKAHGQQASPVVPAPPQTHFHLHYLLGLPAEMQRQFQKGKMTRPQPSLTTCPSAMPQACGTRGPWPQQYTSCSPHGHGASGGRPGSWLVREFFAKCTGQGD